jgi:uncharacterized membrane protein
MIERLVLYILGFITGMLFLILIASIKAIKAGT